MTVAEGDKKGSGAQKPLTIVGGIVGVAIGAYAGINLLIPLAFTAAVWWAGRKLISGPRQPYLPALAVQTGHLLWLCLGLLYVRAAGLDLVDPVVLIIGLVWLLLKPGLAPVLFLTVFQVLALAINGVSFSDAAIGTNPHKALFVHILWRLMALFCMWQAYLQSRKGAGETVAAAQ